MENLEKENLKEELEEKDLESKDLETVEAEEESDLGLEPATEVVEPEEAEFPAMDVVAEVETTYDYRALKYTNMYILRVKRKSTVVYSAMGIICLIIGLVCFFTMEGANKWISLIIVALGLWTFKNIFTEEAKIDKSLQNFFRTNAPFKQTFTFDRERIRVSAEVDGEIKQADYPWAYIQEIHMIPEYFILFLNGGMPMIIDRNEEKLLQGTKEDLEQLLAEQGALKPFKSYDKPFVKKFIDITYYAAPTFEEDLESKDLESKEEAENKEELPAEEKE